MEFIYFIGSVFIVLYLIDLSLERPDDKGDAYSWNSDLFRIVIFTFISSSFIGMLKFAEHSEYLDCSANFPGYFGADVCIRSSYKILVSLLLVIIVSDWLVFRNELKGKIIHMRDSTFVFLQFAIIMSGLAAGALIFAFIANRLDVALELIR